MHVDMLETTNFMFGKELKIHLSQLDLALLHYLAYLSHLYAIQLMSTHSNFVVSRCSNLPSNQKKNPKP
jgi:hypothetical protein